MKRKLMAIVMAATILGCSQYGDKMPQQKDAAGVASSSKDITDFSILGVTATITGNAVSLTVPYGTNVTALVATFTTTGASVNIAGTDQVSGTTANNFSTPQTYTVVAADGSTKDYTVTVTVAPATAKDITAFSILGQVGTITGNSISVTVPQGVNTAALVATFTTTGASVNIAGTNQVSGTTANNFATAKTYTVVAADSSTKNYTVTVTLDSAPAITAQWVRSIVNGASTSYFNAIATDSLGNIYAVGYQSGNSSFTYASGIVVTGTYTGTNAVLVKYNSAGVVQWARSVTTGSNASQFYAVAVDGSGNIYVAGNQKGTGTYTYGTGVSVAGIFSSDNAVLVKYDSTGTALWARSVLNGSGYSGFFGIAVDNTGNVYAAGHQYGNSSYSYAPGASVTGGSSANSNAVLVKYNSVGTAQWARSVTTDNDESHFRSIAIDSVGNIYAVGYQVTANGYTYGSGVSVAGSGNENAVIVKYNSAGTAQWARSVTSGSSESVFNAVTVDSSGNIYAAGYQQGTGSYTYGSGVSVAGTSSSPNVVLVKYDSSGTAQWARSVTSGSSQSVFNAVAVDSSGNIYAAGYQEGTSNYTYGTGVSVAGSGSSSNVVLAKYSPSGSAQWARSVTAGLTSSNFTSVTVDSSGSIYAAGGQSGAGSYTYDSGVSVAGTFSGSNIALVKYADAVAALSAKSLTTFSGLGQTASIGSNVINITLPYGSNVTALVATFNTTGASVNISGVNQVSGSTANNFTTPKNYTVVATDGSTKVYTVTVTVAETGKAQWARSVTAGNSSAVFNAVAADSVGNIYAVGYQSGINSYTYGAGVSVAGIYSSSNAVLVKYDSTGTALWARSVTTGSSYSNFNAVAVDSSGNVYAAGYQDGTSSYTYGTGVSVAGSGNSNNAVLVKYDSSGAAQWAQSITTGGSSLFNAVAVDSSGNIYTAGQQKGTSSYTYGTGVSVAGSGGSNNAVLVKYNSSGTAQWAQSITTGSDSLFNAVAVDSSGNIYTAGQQKGNGNYTYSTGVSVTGSATGTYFNAVVVKYDANGTAQWARSVTTGSNSSRFLAVSVDSSGNIYAAGYQESGGYTYGTGLSVSGSGSYNAVLVKYDSSGTAQWARSVIIGSGSFLQAVAVDNSGNVYAAGYQSGSGSYTYGSGVSVAGSASGAYNVVLLKYDSSGTAQWARSVTSGGSNSMFNTVAVDNSGGVYAAGNQYGTGSYTYGSGVSVAGSATGNTENVVLVKYSE